MRDDIVATNYHVIHGATRGYAKIVGKEAKYDIAGFVAIDRINDLALLKVKGVQGRSLRLNGEDAVSIGDEVFAVGNPQGLEGTFSQGIVSGIRRQDGYKLVQITASISAGSSGGPVLNNQGEVIGIAVGAIQGGQSLNFAIPVTFLISMIANPKPVLALTEINRTSTATKLPSASISPPGRGIPNRPSGNESIQNPPRQQVDKTDISEAKLVGAVRSVRITKYRPEMKFGRSDNGLAREVEVTFYDSKGNKEFAERYFLADPFENIRDLIESSEPFEPYRGKYLYSRSITGLTKTSDYYFGPISGKAFNFNRRIISKYDAHGQLREESEYLPDGKLDMVSTSSTDGHGLTTLIVYWGSGKQWLKQIKYTDAQGVQISEEHFPPEKLLSRSKLTRGPENMTLETVRYDDNGISKTITILDPRLEEPIEEISYESDGAISSKTRYDYKLDSAGNWMQQVELKQVSKFGKTYFEPVWVIIRSITYYSATSTTRNRNRVKDRSLR